MPSSPIDSGYTLADRTTRQEKQQVHDKASVNDDVGEKEYKWSRRASISGTSAIITDLTITPPSRGGRGRKWIRKHDASSGEPYYVNLTSGETTWARPNDYVEVGSEYYGYSFECTDSLATVMSIADLYGKNAVQERTVLKESKSSEMDSRMQAILHETQARLSTVLKALQTCGTEVEWSELVRDPTKAFAQLIYSYWDILWQYKNVAIDLLVCQILGLLGKIDSRVYLNMVSGLWGRFGAVSRVVMRGIDTCLHYEDDDGIRLWLVRTLIRDGIPT